MTIECKIGNTINWACSYKDSLNVSIPLTGYSVKCQARLNRDSSVVLFDLSIGSGITITDVANGLFTIRVDDTSAYTVDTFYVDIKYIDANSVIVSTDTFELKMIKNITA